MRSNNITLLSLKYFHLKLTLVYLSKLFDFKYYDYKKYNIELKCTTLTQEIHIDTNAVCKKRLYFYFSFNFRLTSSYT